VPSDDEEEADAVSLSVASKGAGSTVSRVPSFVSLIWVYCGEMVPVVARLVGLSSGPMPSGSVSASK
jgi:hypothetical protein